MSRDKCFWGSDLDEKYNNIVSASVTTVEID